jgi:glycosyltransferase EpsF
MRVVQVLSSLKVGGIEIWLRNLVKTVKDITEGRVDMDFITLIQSGGDLEPELKELGCNIYHVPLRYKRLDRTCYQLIRLFRKGRYHAVHCQASYLGGIVLPCAAMAGVPKRLLHVHSAKTIFDKGENFRHRMIGRILRFLAIAFSENCIGCSHLVLDSFMGVRNPMHQGEVIHCAIPVSDYQKTVLLTKKQIRQKLEWPQEQCILLHVGRHSEAKNLEFLLKTFAYLTTQIPGILLVLAGEGELTKSFKQRAKDLGIMDQVWFLSVRRDIPLLMRASDLFIFPSFHEGLPVVLIEALATGLPIVAADHITREVDIVPGMISWHGLDKGPESWANLIQRRLKSASLSADKCFEAVVASDFNIEVSARKLLRYYGYDGKITCNQSGC